MKLLFICTHNRCRSILAEAIARHCGGFVTASAGSAPAGVVHPLTLQYLTAAQIPIDGLCSQSWDELEGFNPDVVVTVCDSAAKEACPLWFGQSLQVHWGLPDPSKVVGTEEEVARAFCSLIDELKRRIKLLKATGLEDLEKDELLRLFEAVGGSA